MKAEPLLDDLSARALDFSFLRESLSPASPYGERLFESIAPFAPGKEALATTRAERIARVASALSAEALDAMREVCRVVPDASGALARASMGESLSDANFLELQRFFDACVRLDGLHQCADLPAVARNDVRETAGALERGRAGKFGFYLDDAFDGSLSSTRAALRQAQAEYDAARGRAIAAVASALGRQVDGTEFIVMRADLSGPLPLGVRVVREAPTYFLCEIDLNDQTLAALRRRDEANDAVAHAEEGVRRALTDLVRSRAAALSAACDAFGECDVLVSAARFAQRHHCTVATIDAKAFELVEARFIPLLLHLEKQGRSFTPVSFALDGVAVLTGPNMGGKSVCLRTAGFIAMCAAYGVPVPAAKASLPIFAEIAWLGVGTEETDGGLLSSFAREVVRLRDVLAHRGGVQLALLDEFARTTTPREGHALLVSVLRNFASRGARAIAATHLAGVAQPAGARHFAVRGLRGIPKRPATNDLDSALATLAASMDYSVEEVSAEGAGAADAIALASLLGLDEAVTRAAYDVMKEPM